MLVQVLSILAAASAVTAQSSTVVPAPKVTGNPTGASYGATLPEKAGSSLRGSLVATSGPDGNGVKFTVSISGLPETGGPFMYHLHAKPVPADGNCTGTGAHLDPYLRGEVPICDASKPETCQTGDLSGKYGNMTAREWSQEYVDPYSSTTPGTPAFFGDLSFVVHLSNKTRIGCANFTQLTPGVVSPTVSIGSIPKPSEAPIYNTTAVITAPTTGLPIRPTTAAPPAQVTTNAAAQIVGGTGAMLALAAALVL